MFKHNIKTMIRTFSTAEGVKIASELKESGIIAIVHKADEETILNHILSDKPDTVILDLTLNGTDAAAIMEKASALLPEAPSFIILSDIKNNFIEKQLLALGAYHVFVKPIEKISELADTVAAASVRIISPVGSDPELLVTELMHNIGIPPHIKGYRYIRTSILECLRDRTLSDHITKSLYPKVAEIHNATPSRVERAVRHAIKSTWERGNRQRLYSSLGYSPDTFDCCPTNSEFIAMSVDCLRLKTKTNRNSHFSSDIIKTSAKAEASARLS